MNKTKAGLTLTGSEGPDNTLAIDYKSGATGFGGVIGVDFKASEKLNVAIHYETQVKMEFEATDNTGNFKLEPDGAKSRRDLPAALNTGLTYKLNDKLTGGFDFNYYFQKNADWGLVTNPLTGEKSEASEVAGDCYKMALGFNYLMNDKLEFSIGSSYTFYNYEDMALYYTKMGPFEVLKYDNFNLGIGAGYNIIKNIRFDLGIMRTFWKDQTIRALNAGVPPLMVDVNSSATVVALGLDFRF